MAAPEFFVYYRIAAVHEELVSREVADFQSALRERFPGLQTRLLRRQGDGEDQVTLMETYRLSAESGQAVDSAELLGAIELAAAVLQRWLLGARHVEVFEPCA